MAVVFFPFSNQMEKEMEETTHAILERSTTDRPRGSPDEVLDDKERNRRNENFEPLGHWWFNLFLAISIPIAEEVTSWWSGMSFIDEAFVDRT